MWRIKRNHLDYNNINSTINNDLDNAHIIENEDNNKSCVNLYNKIDNNNYNLNIITI